MKIKVKEATMVKPAGTTPRRSLWLSDLDLLYGEWYIPIVYFFKPNGDSNFFHPTILKEALGKALVLFYPLAGRFRHDDDGRLEIDCNGQGVLFVEAESSSVVDDFRDNYFMLSPELRRLTPHVSFSAGNISSFPFMVSQVTYFKCGGVSLGIGVEHRVIDVHSTFHFVHTWSEIARGVVDVTIPPFLDRTILFPRNPPQQISNHIEYQKFTQAKSNTTCVSDHSSKMAVFKVTSEQLKMLKAKARKELGSNTTFDYSTYEILAGHIWKCTCIARKLPIDQETVMFFPVNGRSRLRPQLPPGYFGNVIFSGVSCSAAGDLQLKPLCYAASRIHEALVSLDNNYLRSVINYLKLHPGTKRYGPNDYKSPNFACASWLGFPIYDADFGWGKPFYMGPGGMNMREGGPIIFPNNAASSVISIFIALQHEPMKVFEKLFYDVFYETERVNNSFGRSKL